MERSCAFNRSKQARQKSPANCMAASSPEPLIAPAAWQALELADDDIGPADRAFAVRDLVLCDDDRIMLKSSRQHRNLALRLAQIPARPPVRRTSASARTAPSDPRSIAPPSAQIHQRAQERNGNNRCRFATRFATGPDGRGDIETDKKRTRVGEHKIIQGDAGWTRIIREGMSNTHGTEIAPRSNVIGENLQGDRCRHPLLSKGRVILMAFARVSPQPPS